MHKTTCQFLTCLTLHAFYLIGMANPLSAEEAPATPVPVVTEPVAAPSPERFALVIGNSAYEHCPKLWNPANDARDMSKKLREAGFETMLSLDLDLKDMKRVFRDFSQQLTRDSVAVVFYAGFGIEVKGVNYLLPVDANLNSVADVDLETVMVSDLLDSLNKGSSESGLKILLMDTCRDNPFASKHRGLSPEGGLATVMGGGEDGLIIVYPCLSGQTSEDGKGANSPFTLALLKHLFTPGVEVHTALRQVARELKAEREHSDRSMWMSSSYFGEFCFVNAMPMPTATTPSK